MNTSRSNVSRLLTRAANLGCFVERTVREFVPSKVTAERLEELRSPDQPQELYAVLQRVESETGVRVRRLNVLGGAARQQEDGSFDEAHLAEFGRAAAPRVADLLNQCDVVAVTWGTTLSRIVDGLKAHHVAGERHPPLKVIPVCAEAEEFIDTPESSSSLAVRISEIMNGRPGTRLALTRVPAFIPRRLVNTPQEKGIRDMMWASPSYREIFGKPNKGWNGATGGLPHHRSRRRLRPPAEVVGRG